MKSLLLGKDAEVCNAELSVSMPPGVLVALGRSLRLPLETTLTIPFASRSTQVTRQVCSRFDRSTLRSSPGLDLLLLTIYVRCLARGPAPTATPELLDIEKS